MKTSRSFSIRMDHQFWLSVNKNLIQAKEIDLNDFQKNLGDQQKKYFQQNELMKIHSTCKFSTSQNTGTKYFIIE